MADSKFDSTVASLFKGMDGFLSAKTVVGEAVKIDDTIIVPLVDVTFGMAAGAGTNESKNKAMGGMGGKMSPSAVLVINNGVTRMVSVKNQDTVSKIIDMVPDIMDKVTNLAKKKNADVDETVNEMLHEEQ